MSLVYMTCEESGFTRSCVAELWQRTSMMAHLPICRLIGSVTMIYVRGAGYDLCG